MQSVKITTVFDNTALDSNCTPEWGFGAVIELPNETILFDTGNDGQILRNNLIALGFSQTSFSKIIISHMHWDHTGGLQQMIQLHPKAQVFLPASATEHEFNMDKDRVVFIREPQRLCEYVYSLGEMPARANEQAIAIQTAQGLVIITGCAHPGIVNITRAAHKQFPNEQLLLVMGGFHLGNHSKEQVLGKIADLEKLGVKKVSPTHCTGETAIALFEQEYGDNFVKPGVGLFLEFPLSN
jgi:7,8-dihydropterin-6-yl-methyl-4-(beta-D-ribofuranosyl)aminobenzene 5'-phosphate synthase